jgi:aminoglycoside phosphotransferase (APT) family kinase protein
VGGALVHGALTCENMRRTERGVVIVDWSRAHLGDPVEDRDALERAAAAYH